MKAVNFFKLAVAAALVIGIGFLTPTDSGAASSTIGSTVSIIAPVTIDQEADQDWGIMVVPSTGSDIWIMDPCSGDVSGGTLGNNPLDDEFAGSFRINGTGTLAVKFTATIGANFSGVDAPVLSVITTCPATSPQDLTGGVLVVGVGATLTVATSTAASATPYTATINVSANY